MTPIINFDRIERAPNGNIILMKTKARSGLAETVVILRASPAAFEQLAALSRNESPP